MLSVDNKRTDKAVIVRKRHTYTLNRMFSSEEIVELNYLIHCHSHCIALVVVLQTHLQISCNWIRIKTNKIKQLYCDWRCTANPPSKKVLNSFFLEKCKFLNASVYSLDKTDKDRMNLFVAKNLWINHYLCLSLVCRPGKILFCRVEKVDRILKMYMC